MSVFQSIVKKEALHLVRDLRTLLIVLIMPMVLLLLFGFAISTEVNNVRVVAVVDRYDDVTRRALARIGENPYFTFAGVVASGEPEAMMRRGEIDAAVVFHDGGRQVIVDASNTTSAQAAAGYLESALSEEPGASAPVLTSTMYNPQLKSAYNFVPGVMGMIFILICAMMTSVSIVSEKERGTMDLLSVSPVRPHTVILGKLVPYLVLSCIILSMMLVLAYTVLGLPYSSAVVNVVWISLLYIALSLCFGLLISSVVDTQVTALLVSGVLLMIPVIMLSGMIFPIDNMPRVLQWLSCIIPARWYISAMRVLMIQQLPVRSVLTEVAVLGTMTAFVLVLAVKQLKTRR